MMPATPVETERSVSHDLIAYNRATEGIFVLVALAAFSVYWLSSFALVARGGTQHFHVDTWLYAELAEPNLLDRIVPDSQLARIFRFHPVTVVLAAGWMKLVSPLGIWFTSAQLLKALFAAVGAVGVWAALRAFASFLPRRHAVLWGAIYASSLGIWYFSSIEESKIVTASLTALYIAAYFRIRESWSLGRAVQLSAILLVACLNEIVAAFLVALPAVDTIVRKRWQAWKHRWIAVHVVVPVISLALLESMMRGWSSAIGTHPEGANHFSMFIYYASQARVTFDSVYYFLASWLFFNIVAPERYAYHWANLSIHFDGIFMPGLANYVVVPLPGALVAVSAALFSAIALFRKKSAAVTHAQAIMLALFAYAIARAAFFFIFNSKENMLFAPSATLAHLLLLAIPYAATTLPEVARVTLLALVAALLFANNGLFIIG